MAQLHATWYPVRNPHLLPVASECLFLIIEAGIRPPHPLSVANHSADLSQKARVTSRANWFAEPTPTLLLVANREKLMGPSSRVWPGQPTNDWFLLTPVLSPYPFTPITPITPMTDQQCVPFGMRTMWVHAYQSHIWNSLACARIRKLGVEAVPGDLVLPAAAVDGGADVEIPPPVVDGGSTEDDIGDVSGADRASNSNGTEIVCELPPPAPIGEASTAPAGGGGSGRAGGADKSPDVRGANPVLQQVPPAGQQPGRPAAAVGGGGKGAAVSVLTREMIDTLASEGVTPRDLLRRVVLPLVGTSVKYPLHEVPLSY